MFNSPANRGIVAVLIGVLLQAVASNHAEAQFFQRLGEKVKEMTAAPAGNSASSSQSGTPAAAPTGDAQRAMMMGMFGMGGDTKTENEYIFDVSIKYDIEVKKKRGKPELMQMTLLHRDGADYSGTRVEGVSGGRSSDQEGVMISDAKNGVMVMLSETRSGKQSVVLPAAMYGMTGMGANTTAMDQADTKMPAFEDLGQKTLLGMQARGYRLRDQSKVIEFWTTQDLPEGLRKALAASRERTMLGSFVPALMPMGFLLEMTSSDGQSGEIVTMSARDVNLKTPVRFVMSEYPKQSF